MNLILTNFYIFLLAIVLVILEIQIEGAHGWAKNLPAWRPTGKWYTKLYERIMSGKEFTGYHLTMFSFVFLIFHLPYVFGLPLTLENWTKTISLFFIFIVLWDFLWFILNPHYPLSRFKKEHIWWHKKWALGAPVDYYGSLILSLLILVISPLFTSHLSLFTLFTWWLFNISLFGAQILAVILFTLYILKIDKW